MSEFKSKDTSKCTQRFVHSRRGEITSFRLRSVQLDSPQADVLKTIKGRSTLTFYIGIFLRIAAELSSKFLRAYPEYRGSFSRSAAPGGGARS